jgi:hypothetical protein
MIVSTASNEPDASQGFWFVQDASSETTLMKEETIVPLFMTF